LIVISKAISCNKVCRRLREGEMRDSSGRAEWGQAETGPLVDGTLSAGVDSRLWFILFAIIVFMNHTVTFTLKGGALWQTGYAKFATAM